MSVLGLGRMGAALAGAFLAAGHRTTVWNRTAGTADTLVEKGAVKAGSAAEAVAASPVTVVCLASYEAVLEVLDPLAGELAGRSLVNLTSGSPPHARERAAWARRYAAEYLDGVVMTTSSSVGNGDHLVLYSGSRAAFDDHRDVLAALAEPVHLGTDAALASVYDTALLGLMCSTLTGWLHGVALVGADGPGGNETATAYTDVATRWMRSVGGLMTAYARQIDAGRYPGGDLTLDLHRSTTDLLVHASELRGVETGLPRLLRDLTGRATAAGHGDDSYARLIEFMRTDDQG
ncbi:NAD(P)-binding domain-containing protein [Streptomyces cinnamoneus]|uniref:imine reductase family protein n=1 Tax=Streptomyces cinnamoneus TaxID=53446 RepID=UPI00311CC2CF